MFFYKAICFHTFRGDCGWCTMRSRCRFKRQWAAKCSFLPSQRRNISVIGILVFVIFNYFIPSTEAVASSGPRLVIATSQPLPTSVHHDFIAPSSSMGFLPPSSISAFVNEQMARQHQNLQPLPQIKPPQALQSQREPYSQQTIQQVTPPSLNRWPSGPTGPEFPSPSPVYQAPSGRRLQPVEQLEAAQSGTIVFTRMCCYFIILQDLRKMFSYFPLKL